MSKSAVKLTFDHKINRKQSSLNRHTHRYKKLKLWETRYKWEGEYKEKKEVEMKKLEEKIAQNEMELAELKTKKKAHEKELKAKTINIWGKAMSKAAKDDETVAQAKAEMFFSGYLSKQDARTVEDDIKAAVAIYLNSVFIGNLDEKDIAEIRQMDESSKLLWDIDISDEVNCFIDENSPQLKEPTLDFFSNIGDQNDFFSNIGDLPK
ncbi:hypothetical protein [Psychrobacter sp. TWP2-1-2]|uniref:hypothetical protein n=1 Tax=Psychrobacter sp. TWP2-1-2 TaxID=2804623 RepID=UPI003CFB7974